MSDLYPHNDHTSYPPHDSATDPSSQRACQYFYQISYEITKDSDVVTIIPYPIRSNAIVICAFSKLPSMKTTTITEYHSFQIVIIPYSHDEYYHHHTTLIPHSSFVMK